MAKEFVTNGEDFMELMNKYVRSVKSITVDSVSQKNYNVKSIMDNANDAYTSIKKFFDSPNASTSNFQKIKKELLAYFKIPLQRIESAINDHRKTEDEFMPWLYDATEFCIQQANEFIKNYGRNIDPSYKWPF